MSDWTRRELLKMGALVPAAAGALAEQSSAEALRESAPPVTAQQQEPNVAATRERLLFDFDWRFSLGNANDPAADFGFGQESIFSKSNEFTSVATRRFDDSQWRAVDLPHDFAVELPFENNASLIEHGAKPLGRRYPATSIGWYRRVFNIPVGDAGRKLSLEFDGVFRDSIVALNGHFLGRNLSGYAPFRYDITDFVNYGGDNYLVVRADATEEEGWFYEGAGIYRHVWLVKTAPLHVAQWGTYVSSEVHGGAAVLSISTEIENESDAEKNCFVESTVMDHAGRRVEMARSSRVQIPAWGRHTAQVQINVNHPNLWSLEDPRLYRLLTQVNDDSGAVDHYENTFGIRTIHFDPDRGFSLNGKPVVVKGTCNHQDHAGVGSALPDRIQYYRIERLKAMGSNGYRTSHNPPTPELLDACDQLGMLVMDETRLMSSDPEGLSQLERLVRRDRNHPCVILWSVGNEEPIQGTDRGRRISATMKRLVRKLDPTRPVTAAMNGGWGKGISNVVDVQGFNYEKNGNTDQFHKDFPAKPCIGSEETSSFCTRGIYENDKERGYVSAYDVNKPDYGCGAEEWWTYYSARPWIAGAFVWTGFDYRGEPSPYSWPCISSHFGIMDTCGFPKDNFFYYQSWWTDKPVVHLLPHWNWPGKEGKEIEVWVHSNCEEVELLLNGASLGRKTMPRNSHLEWKVTYAPGVLVARGFTGGKAVTEDKVETTGAPAGVKLTADRTTINAGGEDVSMVTVAIVDAHGRIVPIADDEVTFAVRGPGKIIGVGNGNPSSHEPDKAAKRRAFNGLAQVIVQSTKQPGGIVLSATAGGLQTATVTIKAAAATVRPAVA
jgi:beta-galactosidase